MTWLQAEAERRKRAQILESEGQRQSKINVAEADKAEVILASEAAQQDLINRAKGGFFIDQYTILVALSEHAYLWQLLLAVIICCSTLRL